MTSARPSSASAVEEAGGEVEDDRVVLARNVAAEGRSRAWVGGAAVPVSALAGVAEPLVAVHGQSDQHRLLSRRAARRPSTASVAPTLAKAAEAYAALYARLARPSASWPRCVGSARERAREADLLRFGLAEIEAVDPSPGEDTELAAEEGRLGYADTLRTAAETGPRGPERGRQPRRAGHDVARHATLLEGVREHDAAAGELADRLAELTTSSPTWRPTWRRTPPAWTPTRPAWPP